MAAKKAPGQAAYEKHCQQVRFPKLQKPWHRLSDDAKAEFLPKAKKKAEK